MTQKTRVPPENTELTGDQVLQIRIELMGAEPGIWRRILIDGECTFWDLHVAIQDAMGWTDSHLHAFHVAEAATGRMRFIGLPMDEDGTDTEPGWEHKVAAVLSAGQTRAMYEYDFGDSWEHAVVLEDVLPADGQGEYPRCVAGERACPPEDVGGIHGYEGFLEAIADPEHEEHDEYLEWVGGAFDSERFNAKDVQFQDPEKRREEVFGEAAAAGVRVVGPPQVEGGFTGEEIQRLVLSPFAEDSALRVETDLPDAVFEQAPLVRDCRSFLQLLAELAPLKLTQKGNLTRATIARLVEAGTLGSPFWWEFKAPRDESDAPRATLLRRHAEGIRLTRKRHGKLDLTKRGRDVVDGKTPTGELYRTLMDEYVSKYNWAFTDAMPESRWLQACFWYTLFLLQEHGAEKRLSSFYASKLVLGFPFVLQDFAAVRYGSPREILEHAFESRMLMGFAVEFGLASASESEDGGVREPRQMWAGPLLDQVVKWRRDAAAGGGARDGDGSVVKGPWA